MAVFEGRPPCATADMHGQTDSWLQHSHGRGEVGTRNRRRGRGTNEERQRRIETETQRWPRTVCRVPRNVYVHVGDNRSVAARTGTHSVRLRVTSRSRQLFRIQWVTAAEERYPYRPLAKCSRPQTIAQWDKNDSKRAKTQSSEWFIIRVVIIKL